MSGMYGNTLEKSSEFTYYLNPETKVKVFNDAVQQANDMKSVTNSLSECDELKPPPPTSVYTRAMQALSHGANLAAVSANIGAFLTGGLAVPIAISLNAVAAVLDVSLYMINNAEARKLLHPIFAMLCRHKHMILDAKESKPSYRDFEATYTRIMDHLADVIKKRPKLSDLSPVAISAMFELEEAILSLKMAAPHSGGKHSRQVVCLRSQRCSKMRRRGFANGSSTMSRKGVRTSFSSTTGRRTRLPRRWTRIARS